MSQTLDPRFFDSIRTAFREGDGNFAEKREETANVERVEDVFRMIGSRDFDALGEVLADNVSLEIIGLPGTPMAGVTQGRRQVIEMTRGNFAQVEDQRPEIRSVVAQGDTVVVLGREQGRFRPTGRSYDLHWMHEYTFRDGKVARIRELFDSAAVLDAVQPPAGGDPFRPT